MAIYLQCNEEKIRNLLVRAEVDLYESERSLDGYSSGLSENVRKQVESIYTAICNMLMEESGAEAELIIDDWFLYDDVIAEKISKTPKKLLSLAAYSLAMFYETGLHGLLIPTKGDLLVGVWLYKDYDYEDSVIRSQELIEEAYDKGGMLLPFSCTSMLLEKTFSEAVDDGCNLLKDYIYAVDINLENKNIPGSIYRNFETKESTEAENSFLDTRCSDVRNNSIAAALLNGYQEDRELQDPAPLDLTLYHLPVSEEALSVATAIHTSPLSIVKASGQKKTEILLENIYAYLSNHKKLLIITDENRDFKIPEQLKKDGFEKFIWFEENKENFDKYGSALTSLSSKKTNKKAELMQKRYEENQKKLNQYLEMLESETVEGVTLIQLLEEVSEAADSRISVSFNNVQEKIVFGSDLRKLFKDYVNAWKDCCYTAPDGSFCFDLTAFTQQEISQLKEMVDASEIIITRFLEKLNEYGYAVDKIYQPDGEETQKGYFKSIMSINDFMVACTDLQNGKDADELPEETLEEAQAVDEYGNYLQYCKIREDIGDTIDLLKIADLDDNSVEKLQEIANRLLKSNLDSVSIPIPRQLVRDSQDMEDMLRDNHIYTSSESLKCKAGVDKNIALKAVSEALIQIDLIRNTAGNETYKDVYDLFGSNVSDNGYLFGIQRDLVKYYMCLMSDAGIKDETRNIVNDMMRCMIKPEYILTAKQNALLDQAVVLFTDYYTPFHEMEKEIFGFLNLSYKAFDQKFPDRMLMEFILEWKEFLMCDQQYDNYVHVSAALERNYLKEIVNQIRQIGLTPEESKEEFEHFWIAGAAAFWVEQIGFDYADYKMTVKSLKNCEEQILAEKNVKLYNSLLAERQEILSKHTNLISEKEKLTDILRRDAEVLFSIYPVFIVNPHTAADIAGASDLLFDRMIILDGENIPFQKVLCLVEKSEALTIIVPEKMDEEAENDSESVAHRAVRMGIPFVPAEEKCE